MQGEWQAGNGTERIAVPWLTGLSGAGKSTIARLLHRRLRAEGRPATILDGDALRAGLCRDLGFSEADRRENIRRVAELAILFAEAGVIPIVALISPYRADRAAARARIGQGFLEVFVDTPIAECRRRDVKGLYARADAGTLPQFTGVGAPYEPPEAPELRLDTAAEPAEALAERVAARLLRYGAIHA